MTLDDCASTPAAKLGLPALKRLVTLLVATAVWGLALFLSAGRLGWFRGWFYIGLFLACVTVTGVAMARVNPDLVNRRGMKHSGTKRFDRFISAAYTLLVLAMAVVAGLDVVRFGWSSFGPATIYPGAALFVAGVIPILWAAIVNPFLETTVRIQTDRDHRVVASGPYATVRHPMYVGIILQNLSAPLILGSRWAYVPAGLVVALFVLRTALEDRTLRNELPGYEEFARRTRYRLLPGIW